MKRNEIDITELLFRQPKIKKSVLPEVVVRGFTHPEPSVKPTPNWDGFAITPQGKEEYDETVRVPKGKRISHARLPKPKPLPRVPPKEQPSD